MEERCWYNGAQIIILQLLSFEQDIDERKRVICSSKRESRRITVGKASMVESRGECVHPFIRVQAVLLHDVRRQRRRRQRHGLNFPSDSTKVVVHDATRYRIDVSVV